MGIRNLTSNKIFVIVFLAVVAIGFLVYILGDDTKPVIETTRKNMKEKIINLIGKYEVQITKIDMAISDCKNKANDLIKQEANVSVEADYAKKNLEKVKASVDSNKEQILKLADLIEKGQPVVNSEGKTVSVAELNSIASRAKTKYQILTEKYSTVKNILDTYNFAKDQTNKDRVYGQETITLLADKKELLLAKMENLKSISMINVDNDNYKSVFDNANSLLDETIKQVDKEVNVNIKMREINNSNVTIEIETLTKDSQSIAQELRQIVK
jgi:hypothetical protein